MDTNGPMDVQTLLFLCTVSTPGRPINPSVHVCRGHHWSSKSSCPCVLRAPLVVQISCRRVPWAMLVVQFFLFCVPWAPLVVQITLLSCAAPLDVQIRLFLCAVGTADRPKSKTSCYFLLWAPLVVYTLLSRCAVGKAGLPTMVPALRVNNAYLPKQGFELSIQGVKFQPKMAFSKL